MFRYNYICVSTLNIPEVLARPDRAFTALTYLPEAVLQQLWPVETILRVKALRKTMGNPWENHAKMEV